MSDSINIAFCTDFSELSRASLESILFNTWNFNCNIHLLHYLEDEDEDTALSKLNLLTEEVKLEASEGQDIQNRLFRKNECQEMINNLNNGKYHIIASGMPFKTSEKCNSFITQLTKQVNKDLTLIPANHKVKIENRTTILLDIKNLDNLHITNLFEEYYKFLFAKITIIILSDELLDIKAFNETHEKVKKIMPNLDITIANHDKSQCIENLKTLIEKDNIDAFVVFKHDYGENFMLNIMNNNIDGIRWNFTLYRSYVDDTIISNLKKGVNPYPKMQLNE